MMPYFDGTGPMGYGPMTGRGRGPCGGLRRGRGLGRGFGWRQFKPADYQANQQEETQMIKDYVKDLEEELKVAKEEMKKLDK